ncbi:AI-2E family transporter [archaeon]|nr:AI-2E family transporter [archaeon]
MAMDKSYLRKVTSLVILAVLIVLSYFLLKPILMSIITGIILAFIFLPVFQKINKKIPSRNVSVTIVCILLILLIVIPVWFLTPVLLNQSIEIFLASQKIDFVTPLQNAFPKLFSIGTFSNEITSVVYSFITKITNGAMNMISKVLLNFPTLFLQFLVTFFTFFFVLRDSEKFVEYIQSLLPFPKEIETKLFKSSRDITFSVLYGQVIIGILQGIFAGISFFLFGVGNALFLTLLAIIAGIFPIIGTTVVWIPVAIYLFVNGQLWPAIGVTFFGLIASFFENAVKPVFVSKRTNVHSSIILLGMVGGLFMFGILGVILGPLILAYLLIVLEIYRDKRTPSYLIQNPEDQEIDIKMGYF